MNINEDNLLITKDNVAITDRCRNDSGCDTADNTFTVTVTSFSEFVLAAPKDSDGDDVPDGFEGVIDSCPLTPGLADRQGCPVGDANLVELHIVDQAKSGACLNAAGSCKFPAGGAEVRVFDRNDADFQASYGTKNPDDSIYDQVFENDIGRIGACTADSSGQCTAGEETTGDYLVIVKYVDSSGKTVYTGKPKGPEDFDATGLASKDFQVIKVLRKNGVIQFSGGRKTVVSGSYLEIVYPDFAVWDDVAAGYVYPFIFTSDSDWTVDACAEMPKGYEIVGVYDENGDLVSEKKCIQTFVAGETKVVAFDVVEVGSPEPKLKAKLKVRGPNGKVKELDLDVPGIREYKDKKEKEKEKSPHSTQGSTAAVTVFPGASIGGLVLVAGIGTMGWARRRNGGKNKT